VDEALAVGDFQFQKMLGKNEGVVAKRETILFVSHNMAMINSLFGKAMQLENGALRAFGATDRVILGYATSGQNSPAAADYRSDRRIGDEYARRLSADIRNERGVPMASVKMEYRITSEADRIAQRTRSD